MALVAGGGGGGTAIPRHGEPAPDPGGRADTGGGFGALVLPAGVYVVKGDQVRWIPAVDPTIVVLASLTLVRIVARTWARSRRHHTAPR